MQQRAGVDEPSFHTHADTHHSVKSEAEIESNVCSCIYICKREEERQKAGIKKTGQESVRTACICLCILIFLALLTVWMMKGI